jgi:hypothetical protein
MKYATCTPRRAHIALYAVVFILLQFFISIKDVHAEIYGSSDTTYIHNGIDGATALQFSVVATTTLRYVEIYATATTTDTVRYMQYYAPIVLGVPGIIVTATRYSTWLQSETPSWQLYDFSTSTYYIYPNNDYELRTDTASCCDLIGSASSTAETPYAGWAIRVYTGSSAPETLAVQPAKIISISPEYGSTTASTTTNLLMTFHNDGQYNSASVQLSNYDPDGFGFLYSTATPSVVGTTTIDFGSFNLVPGYWVGSFNLLSDTSGTLSFPASFVASSSRTTDAWYDKISASSTAEIQSYCAGKSGIDAILCKIPDAIISGISFLLKPSDNTFDRFKSLKTSIENKPPFGYISVSLDVIDGLTASSTGIFALQQEGNITTTIFDPIKSGLSMILYVFWAFVMFHRVRHIDI